MFVIFAGTKYTSIRVYTFITIKWVLAGSSDFTEKKFFFQSSSNIINVQICMNY